jgi:putative ABC transport system permease protein
MWLIARRTAAQQWRRLLATLATIALAVGLVAGSAQLGQQARAAVARIRASEYARTTVIVRAPGAVIPGTDPSGTPPESRAGDGRLGADVAGQVATVPGVVAVAGDAAVPADLVGADHKVVTASGGAPTQLRPWVADPSLSAYRLVAGRAPAAAGEVAVVRSLARAGRLQVGATTTLILPQDARTVRVVGIVTVGGADAAARGAMVLAPSRSVQEAAGLDGVWPVLMVGAAAGTDPSILRDRIRRALHGDGVVALGADIGRQQIEAAEALGNSIAALLLILAFVGVFIGVFVAASAFSTLVRQRIRQLALLRVVGATPRQVRRLVRLEALLVGVGASAVGLPIGLGIARLLAWQLAKIGLDVDAAGVQLGPVYGIAATLVGLLTTQLAAWSAARASTRIPPIAALSTVDLDRSARSWPRVLIATVLLAGAAALVRAAFSVRAGEPTTDSLTAVALLIVAAGGATVTGLAALGPFLTAPLGWLVGSVGVAIRGEVGRLARATITRNPRRVATAASMLMLAVTLATVTGLAFTSVRERTQARAQVMLAATHAVTAVGQTGLPADITTTVRAVAGVRLAVPLARTDARIVGGAPGQSWLSVTGTTPATLTELIRFPVGGAVLHGLRDGQIAISASRAAQHHWRPGQRLRLLGPAGEVQLTVAGVFHDPSHLFAEDAIVTNGTLRTLDHAAFTSAVLVQAAPGTDAAALTHDLEHALADIPTAQVHDRDGLLRVLAGRFVQATGLFYLFIGVAILIAVFGMATTLSLSVYERTREFSLLRAVGATPGQLRSVVRWEAATVVLLGTLLGVSCGVLIVHLMHLVTRTSLISARLPLGWAALIPTAAAAVTLLGSLLPARRAARASLLTTTKVN